MRKILVAISFLALASCGGGDGGSNPPVQLPPTANAPPQITSGATLSVAENQTTVASVTATDSNGDQLSFSISGGADASAFSIGSTGALAFSSAPNFELPTDVGLDNIYNLTVAVSDGTAAVSQNLTVTVENDREGISVRRVATGLNDVTSISAGKFNNVLHIAERGGSIRFYNANTEVSNLAHTVRNVNTDGEGGLLGLTADPNDPTVRWAFVVAEFTVQGDLFNRVNVPGSEIMIRRLVLGRSEPAAGSGDQLTITHPTNVNYGGAIGFDPVTGHLFVGVGDAGDPDNAQNPNSQLGKVLRAKFNPDPFAGASPIPFLQPALENPFISGGGDPFVYSLGVQNPRDLTFIDGNLVFGDSGASAVEELNAAQSSSTSENFGWPFFEGSIAFQGTTASVLTAPVSEYAQGNGDREGRQILGGRTYSGPIASLQGKYIFADTDSGKIWAAASGDIFSGNISSDQYELLNTDFTPVNGSIGKIVAFAISASGDLFFADSNGELFAVEPA